MLMNSEQTTGGKSKDRGREPDKAPSSPAVGTEAEQKGGKEPARQQAERDWEHSSKESGE
jgi:hypothetical protein